MTINVSNIPKELRDLRQWTCWKLENPEGRDKPTKVPYTTRGSLGSTTNPAQWSTLAECLTAVDQHGFSGVGFVFTKDDPYVGVDLDGMAWEKAESMVHDLLPAYVEISQSGKGIHVIMRGTLPPGQRRKGHVEAYTTARYFAITANIIGDPVDMLEDRTEALAAFHAKYLGGFSSPGSAQEPSTQAELTPSDMEVIEKIRISDRARDFAALFDGFDPKEFKGDRSKADFTLIEVIGEFTLDEDQVVRIMAASSLMREKWHENRAGVSLIRYSVRNGLKKAAQNSLSPKKRSARKVKAVVRTFDQIKEEKIKWLWPGVIPYGKLCLIIGDPGHGKSFITLDVAARISAAVPLPDDTKVVPTKSLLVFCEDGAGDTVKPRLKACGADQTMIGELAIQYEDGTDRLLDLDTDLAVVEKEIVERDVRLLVLDPLSAYLGPKVNSWKDDEVRRMLASVAGMADRTKCAVVAIMHLNKKMTSNVLQRATGAGAFTAVARSVWMVGVHPDDTEKPAMEQRKIFAPAKLNIAAVHSGWCYNIIGEEGKAARLEWKGRAQYTASDLVKSEMTGIAGDGGKIGLAVSLIKHELAHGRKTAKEILEAAQRNGISAETLKRAKRQLTDVISVQETDQALGRNVWYWKLANVEDPLVDGDLSSGEPDEGEGAGIS